MSDNQQIDEALYDQIGPWSEVKLEIIREYAAAYSRIFSAPGQSKFSHVYIDAFAGAGRFISRRTRELVPGSPVNAVATDPPFDEYLFIDISEVKVARLEEIAGEQDDVTVLHGDANEILLQDVLPRVRYRDFRRGLCLLDPYGMHYHWETVQAIGRQRTIDLFLNFPIMDINRNVLLRNPAGISTEQAGRMTAFWGDESWREGFYSPDLQLSLFGDRSEHKEANNLLVVNGYIERLKTLAGFEFVPDAMPMRNRSNADVYYLLFAAHKPVASKIVEQIFDKYRRRGAANG